MKHLLLLLLATLTMLPVQRATGQVATWKQIPVPQLPAFKPQQPKRIELSNGMVTFLQEHHELPLIYASARTRASSAKHHDEQPGKDQICGEVWRTGGTR